MTGTMSISIELEMGLTDQICFLYGRAICHRVGEWDSEFNDICSSILHGEQYRDRIVGRWVSSGNECHQSWLAL